MHLKSYEVLALFSVIQHDLQKQAHNDADLI